MHSMFKARDGIPVLRRVKQRHAEVDPNGTFRFVVAEHVAGKYLVKECSMAKLWITEMNQRVVDQCLGAGFGLPNNWSNGNFNYDANVTLADFTLLAAAFGLAVPSDLPRSAPTPPALSPFGEIPIDDDDLGNIGELVI